MNSIISDARQQEMNLDFQFDLKHDQLAISINAKDATYQSSIHADPRVNLNQLQELLLTKQFKIITKRSDILVITVAGMDLDFQNIDKITINQLRQTIANFQQREIQSKAQLEIYVRQHNRLANERQEMMKNLQGKKNIENQRHLLINQHEKSTNLMKRENQRLKNIVDSQNQQLLASYQKNQKLQEKIAQLKELVIQERQIRLKLERTIQQNETKSSQRIQKLNTKITDLKDQLYKSSDEIEDLRKILYQNETSLIQNNSEVNKKENPQFSPSQKADQVDQLGWFTEYHKLSPKNQTFITVKDTVQKQVPLNSFFKSSKIVTDPKENQKIINFFEKRIKNTKLLYRASQSQFSVSRFHQKCDNIPNTVTIVHTEFNKKIGGYTPLKWQSRQNWKYKKDDLQESFLFSFTGNDKFQLTGEDYAIQNHKDYGPTFGEHRYGRADLSIWDKANKNDKSYARGGGITYENPNYYAFDQDSTIKFGGNLTDCTFKTLEWEVWQVEFKQN